MILQLNEQHTFSLKQNSSRHRERENRARMFDIEGIGDGSQQLQQTRYIPSLRRRANGRRRKNFHRNDLKRNVLRYLNSHEDYLSRNRDQSRRTRLVSV